MKYIAQKLLLSAVSLVAVFAFFAPAAIAQNAGDVCEGVGAAGGSCTETGASTTVDSIVGLGVNIISVIVGIAAVIMIILGGFKYITSGGDSSSVQSAKNTILYAIIGLVVVAMAQMITGFVLDRVTGP